MINNSMFFTQLGIKSNYKIYLQKKDKIMELLSSRIQKNSKTQKTKQKIKILTRNYRHIKLYKKVKTWNDRVSINKINKTRNNNTIIINNNKKQILKLIKVNSTNTNNDFQTINNTSILVKYKI